MPQRFYTSGFAAEQNGKFRATMEVSLFFFELISLLFA